MDALREAASNDLDASIALNSALLLPTPALKRSLFAHLASIEGHLDGSERTKINPKVNYKHSSYENSRIQKALLADEPIPSAHGNTILVAMRSM